MTIRQWMTSYCTERGMSDRQAEAVVEAAMADLVNEPMSGRWNDTLDGYPVFLPAIMAMTLKKAALAYIEANCPEAWFRPLFEE